MRKDEKNQLIDNLAEQLSNNNNFYITDISDLNAEDTSNLRRLCFKRNVQLSVVKNTLLKRAMEKTDKDYSDLYEVIKGPVSIMFADAGNTAARLIKEFRGSSDRPIIKGAFVEEMTYIGDNQLEFLANIKSKDELIGDIIGLLQSPAKNVISALQSGGGIIAGIVKTLSEKTE